MPQRNAISLSLAAYCAALAGIAVYSLMDVFMKSLSLAIGALAALVCRNVLGALLAAPYWYASQTSMPSRPAMMLHLQRAAITTPMSLLFFWALTRLPLAETIAISFIAPVLALFMARTFLGEAIGKAAIIASVLSIIGMAIIIGPRLGFFHGTPLDQAALPAIIAVLLSAALFAYNLILARRQAQIAQAPEIAFMQSLLSALFLLPFALYFVGPYHILPSQPYDYGLLIGAAICTVVGAGLFAWAYARAQAQALIPIEYTGFVWAALLGWLFFDEQLSPPLLVGTALIAIGSFIAARAKPALVEELEQTSL